MNLLSLAPRLALSSANAVRRGAVDNARTATAVLAGRIADRASLDPREAGDEPGTLGLLCEAECLELLVGRTWGRLAFLGRGDAPDLVTVNYAVHRGIVHILSGPGPKLLAAERGSSVALQIDAIDDTTRTGWSVTVVGRARRLTVAEHRALPEQALPEPWAHGPRNSVIALAPTRITGRRLT